jgi:hypothetical protein
MNEPLLTINNLHAPDCGVPPHVWQVGDPNLYVGYFEGPNGDQWVFTYDRDARRGILRGGDITWNMAVRVEAGVAHDLVLEPSEAMWLRAAWAAATSLESGQ